MRKIVTYFTQYTIWSNALIILIVLLGVISAFDIKKAFFPEIDPNLVVVSVAYPGASPEEMEEGVVNKVEEALKGIQGIEEITSTASENSASIRVEVSSEYNPDVVLTDVKNAVDRINSFPVSAEKPVVLRQKPQSDAIDIVLVGDVAMEKLKETAEAVRYDLLAGEGISQVNISGYPSLEIEITATEENLRRYGLTFSQVAQAIRNNNRDISSGSVKTTEEEILIRSRAKEYDAEGIGQIIVRTNTDGSILRLTDIATIRKRFADVPNASYYNGKPAATLKVTKLPEEDVLIITDYVKAYVEEFNNNNSSIEAVLENDRSVVLNDRLSILVNNGAVGLILVLVMLGLFLNLRLSFWVAFGIPFSFLGMLFVADLLGVSINLISLFGMIMVVGILVDDGIVVGENIFAHFEKGKTPLRAAVDGTMEVMGSVFTGVTTTMLTFSAFFFFEGRLGQFLFEMAVVVILCLAFSLIECYFILPPHLAHSGALKKKKPSRFRIIADRAVFFLRDRLYGNLLKTVIRYRYLTFSITLAILFVVIGAVQGGYIGLTFFPSLNFTDDLTATVTLKPGTREHITADVLARVKAASFEVDADLRAERGDDRSFIKSTQTTLGSGGSQSGGHVGSLRLALLSEREMGMPKFQFGNLVREKLGPMPEVEQFVIGDRRAFGKPVSVSLKGRDGEALDGAKRLLISELQRLPDLKDITDSNIPGRREINVQLKPKAYVLGLTHADITAQIRQGFFGEEAQRLQIGEDEVRVWVRYPEEDRRSLGELEEIKITTADGSQYPLTDLIEYETQRGVVDITHLNGAREIRVEADLADQTLPVGPIVANLQSDILPKLKERYPGISYSMEGQSRRGAQFGSSLGKIWPAILIGMVLLISLAFRSFSQSFIIILVMIPLGLLGAAIGHWIEGKPISILSFYGMLALSGVIVNDAVVFGDKFNRLLKQGHTLAGAIFYSGKSRFRPILLTSLTTVVGLFPLIRSTDGSAQFLIPMAISVAYGVLIGTFFVLTTYPAVLGIYNDVRVGLVWLRRAIWDADYQLPSRRLVEPAIKEQEQLKEIG